MNRARSCLVTGGSGHLGGAVAIELARRGRLVGVHYDTGCEEASRIVREAVRVGGSAFAIETELTSRLSATALVEEFVRRNGAPPSALVAAHGTMNDEPLLRTPVDDWDRIMAVNVTSTAWLLQAVCSRWSAGDGGHAVLLGSRAASVGRVGGAAYAASKAALVGLARSVVRELGPDGVKVNVVVPPFVPGGMGARATEEFVERARADSVSSRTGEAAELARFVADLLDGDGISGQVLAADTRVP